MQVLLSMLRSMGQDNFSYKKFRQEVSQRRWTDGQRDGLTQRLDILDSIVSRKLDIPSLNDYSEPGSLIILDLSDPFMDVASACAYFHIAMGLFVEPSKAHFADSRGSNTYGKLVVFDEAHKYLVDSSAELTQNLLSLIRQQRHLGLRVIVATQEPSVIPPAIIDLCTNVIAFRFSSPLWATALAKHVCSGKDIESAEWFDTAVELATGQGILCVHHPLPLFVSVLDLTHSNASLCRFSPTALTANDSGDLTKLARGYLVFQARQRLTQDGGASIMATKLGANLKVGRLYTASGASYAHPDSDANGSCRVYWNRSAIEES